MTKPSYPNSYTTNLNIIKELKKNSIGYTHLFWVLFFRYLAISTKSSAS